MFYFETRGSAFPRLADANGIASNNANRCGTGISLPGSVSLACHDINSFELTRPARTGWACSNSKRQAALTSS